jgi:transposase
MWYAGIDLHRRTAVVAMLDGDSRRIRPRTFQCSRPAEIVEFFQAHRPFRAVIEASCAYRWLYDLLVPHGEVVLAHPLLLKSIWNTRAKTDKRDAEELAELLRSKRIPRSYVPPERYQGLRDLVRERARLVWGRVRSENALHSILWRVNVEPGYKTLSAPGCLKWLESLELPAYLAAMRDERVERVRYFQKATGRIDAKLSEVAEEFPETEALADIHGIGLYSALLVVAEIGEPGRFKNPRQVGAYAGLTPRVRQSGQTDRRGRISKDGSKWLRWTLVQAAMKVTRRDEALGRFYNRVRRRAGKMRARVAVARKLAEIVWKRLCRWHAAPRAA